MTARIRSYSGCKREQSRTAQEQRRNNLGPKVTEQTVNNLGLPRHRVVHVLMFISTTRKSIYDLPYVHVKDSGWHIRHDTSLNDLTL